MYFKSSDYVTFTVLTRLFVLVFAMFYGVVHFGTATGGFLTAMSSLSFWLVANPLYYKVYLPSLRWIRRRWGTAPGPCDIEDLARVEFQVDGAWCAGYSRGVAPDGRYKVYNTCTKYIQAVDRVVYMD